MARAKVIRPVVRSFAAGFQTEAGLHVRAGGHAVVWSSPQRARLVFQKPKRGHAEDLGIWSLLDMGKTSWKPIVRGPLHGLATSPIPHDCIDLVKERIVRDSVHRAATRTMLLDCQECAACCRKNRVELLNVDLARFRRAGRMDLAKPPYVRRDGKKLVLRLLKSGDCRHLMADKRCGIYQLRPDACRTFPAGSEGCLFSREEELGVFDGARD